MGKAYRRRSTPAMILSNRPKKIGWLTEAKSGNHHVSGIQFRHPE
jgi:hypothetical protein